MFCEVKKKIAKWYRPYEFLYLQKVSEVWILMWRLEDLEKHGKELNRLNKSTDKNRWISAEDAGAYGCASLWRGLIWERPLKWGAVSFVLTHVLCLRCNTAVAGWLAGQLVGAAVDSGPSSIVLWWTGQVFVISSTASQPWASVPGGAEAGQGWGLTPIRLSELEAPLLRLVLVDMTTWKVTQQTEVSFPPIPSPVALPFKHMDKS